MDVFILQTAFIVSLLLVVLRWSYRFKSPYNCHPAYQCVSFAEAPSEVDYVIVGGGPAGLAAARQLLESASGLETPSILLIEQGPETLPSKDWDGPLWKPSYDRLLFCSPSSIYSPTDPIPKFFNACEDEHFISCRPFRPRLSVDVDSKNSLVEPEVRKKIQRNEIFYNYTPYPRYKGIGGGSLSDWGIYFRSVFSPETATLPVTPSAKEAAAKGTNKNELKADHDAASSLSWWVLPKQSSIFSSPLSKAFAEAACESLGLKHSDSDSSESFHEAGRICSAKLRTDIDGRRTPLSSWLFRSLKPEYLSRLKNLSRSKVVGFEVGPILTPEDVSVTAVCFEDVLSRNPSRKRRVVVKKGVVLAAGVIQSPRLVRQLYLSSGLSRASASVLNPSSTHTMVAVRDAIALPMIFKTHNGVSSDACNLWSLKTRLQWLLTHRGLFLQPLLDTMASVPLPELGPKAELRICLLPFGGREPELYYKMGWDRMLGSFHQATTFLMILNGVQGGLYHRLALASPESTDEDVFLHHLNLYPLEAASPENDPSRKTVSHVKEPDNVQSHISIPLFAEDNIIDAFVKGISLCRKIIRTKPLVYLSSTAEAIDFSLLREDSNKSIRLAKYMHSPGSRFSAKMRDDFKLLAEWAGRLIHQEEYMRLYVQEHAFWLGFGSGSSECFLESPVAEESGKIKQRFRVKGMRNVVVGDSSSVSSMSALGEFVNSDVLSAGSVSTAIDAGRLAAQELLVN